MTTAPPPPSEASRAASSTDPLEVRSEAIDLTGGLLGRLPASAGALAWVHDGQGLVGWGEVARLEVRGAGRFARAQRWWREQLDRFTVYDDVGAVGSGPVAFASFSFADDSTEASVMVVPEVVLGRRDGKAWLTTIGTPPRLSSPQPVAPPALLRYAHGAASVTAHRAAVTEAVRRIAAGDVEKVVLAHDLVAIADGPIDARFVLAGLADRYPDCWTFAVEGLIGATPELLLALRSGRITSLVLAGTAARGSDEVDDLRLHRELLESAKNLEEHRYALDSLTQALQPHTTSMTVSPTPYLLDLSNVIHLASDVIGTVASGRDALDLIAAVNPSAAVGGTPTPVAVRMLRELEGFDRGRYAGPVGWIDAQGDGEWGIALRCGLLDGNAARLFAGGGIVAESDPDSEVAEAQSKFVPMRDALEGVRN
jgi:menaquinone-specific isochorismate synthase